MNQFKNYFAAIVGLLLLLGIIIMSVPRAAQGQGGTSSKDVNVVNTPTVNAQQSGAWNVGIDPAGNTVRLANTPSDPLPVAVVNSAAGRPFQAQVNLSIIEGGNAQTFTLPVPSGKRFVIEHISAGAIAPAGQQMLLEFRTFLDDGDGVPSNGDFTDHDIVLTEQGTFGNSDRFAANHAVRVFADDRGVPGFGITVNALRNAVTGNAGASVTFSGYLVDLPPSSPPQ